MLGFTILLLENYVTLGYANYGAFVILGDLITLGKAIFDDFV